ncbi:peptide/nickel transport system ATP-binding protein [Nakamurella panacisegetis]|uniref:Peptide/nickel transport system ATP-binding protein n=1 Tax=Nakamurella panacisegetis TaxID=1090615 RepID=A0A1H0SSU9_9ACTN|nr:ABC transporter ATP-binding protein [Nakamurella panacisegetis]SDP44862.1 peptide/nickel transport system ATP-binding protein [Nakamurella panacisegetis]
MNILDLAGLGVSFPAGPDRREVVSGLDLELPAGATLGIVGESGSGKSVTLRALMGLLPSAARVESGTLSIGGIPVPLAGRGLRATRRRRLAMVFQDPLAALDPLMTIGDQIAEVPRRVFGESKRASRAVAVDLLGQVRIPDPERRAGSYPHELSGGQRQRAVIAMALAARPEILLCDEPTTALDVTIQAEILDLLRQLRGQSDLSMIFVSHDLAVVNSMADRILVMRSGRAVEIGSAEQVIERPGQPYTRQLLDAVLELPDAGAPAPVVLGKPRPVRLRADGVSVSYSGVQALDAVGLQVGAASIHGLVGESGSGKTTLAKVLTGQLSPAAGSVVLDGQVLPAVRGRAQLRQIQMIYQDPFASLDPRMTVRQTLSELLRLVVRMPRPRIEARCVELLDQVSLPASALDGYPGQFSGGQRQRIAIARALAVEPTVLVADEPTSALDVSIQAAVLDLLVRLRDEFDLTIVVISHNLAVIRHICDDVSVLRDGVVVDSGTATDVLDHPRTEYTRQLIRAVPRLKKDIA